MAQVTNGIPAVCVMEWVVNVDEFRRIGIAQKFEALGWERLLDWCAENTHRRYMTAVMEWLASLSFENQSRHPSAWKLTADTGRGTMVMSFDMIN
ncbi:hypothetical protein Hanom_Chr13g01204101 [Helianthus anomalus]